MSLGAKIPVGSKTRFRKEIPHYAAKQFWEVSAALSVGYTFIINTTKFSNPISDLGDCIGKWASRASESDKISLIHSQNENIE